MTAVKVRRDVQRAAHRGALFLDKKLGRGWRRKIRRRDLDLAASSYEGPGTCGCVLAQIYGDYDEGLAALGIDEGWKDMELGFDSITDSYDELTEAWKRELR